MPSELPQVPKGLEQGLTSFLNHVRQVIDKEKVAEAAEVGNNLGGGSAAVDGITGTSTGQTPVVCPAQPAPIVDLEAHVAIETVMLTWTYPKSACHSFVRVYRNTINDVADAVAIGDSTHTIFVDKLTPNGDLQQDTDYYYWVRAYDNNGIYGDFNAVDGILVHTSKGTDFVKNQLTAAISESSLVATLSSEIDKIPPLTGLQTTAETLETLLGQANSGFNAVDILQNLITTDLTSYITAYDGSDYCRAADGTVVDLAETECIAAGHTWINQEGLQDQLEALLASATSLKDGINTETETNQINWEGIDGTGGVKAELTTELASATSLKDGINTETATKQQAWAHTDGTGVSVELNSAYGEAVNLKDQIAASKDSYQLAMYTGRCVDENGVTQSGVDELSCTTPNTWIESVESEVTKVIDFHADLSQGTIDEVTQFQTNWTNSGLTGDTPSVILEHSNSINQLGGEYAVKIDNNGKIAGFGLATEALGANALTELTLDTIRANGVDNDGTGKVIDHLTLDVQTINGVAISAGATFETYLQVGQTLSLQADYMIVEWVEGGWELVRYKTNGYQNFTIQEFTYGSGSGRIGRIYLTLSGVAYRHSGYTAFSGFLYKPSAGAISIDYSRFKHSKFTILADRFALTHPGGDISPFYVANGEVYINSAFIADASINSAQIGSVNADKITAADLSALSADMGTLTAGELVSPTGKFNINLTTGVLEVYDAAGQLRVKLGVLS